MRVSNTADIGASVDYSRVYYLNARSSLIGAGTVDAKLNPAGTLGDVSTAAVTGGSGGLTAWSTVAAGIAGSATV